MEIYTLDETRIKREEIIEKILLGRLFIHPTDTIYGIGCNAMNTKAVMGIRETKRQTVRPFSILAPSKEWIYENCEVTPKAEEWIEKLPGPYTMILNLKNESAIAKAVNFGNGTIGVRIPDHWFSKLVAEAGVPTITTSANITGENFMTSRDMLDPMVASRCDFMIDEGAKHGKPSTIVDLRTDEISIQERS